MRHLFRMTGNSDWLFVLLLPALTAGCENQSIRLGGWVPSRQVATAPPAAAAPVPPMAPPPVSGAGFPVKPVREGEMPLAVSEILKSRCAECHTYGLRDPAGWGSVLDVTRMIDSQIIAPGNPEGSRLWYRVAVRNDMPFNGSRLTLAEKSAISNWIQNLQRPVQRPRTQAEILDLLVQDQPAAGNASDTRYVSFADFVDARRSPEEIRTAAAVFNVLLNSLSRGASIVKAVAVDREESIWRFRLRDLGWSEQDWNRLISFYPYCLSSDADRHQGLYQGLRTEAPIVRGDWFLSTALQAPLYAEFLQLGDNLDEIARLNLGIDIKENIAQGKVQRMAIHNGGPPSVRDHVLERHETRWGGYLWLNYHLGPGEDVRDSPLGPRNRNDNSRHSFSSVATEALWLLPNGLQAYALADADGNRIDTASLDVLVDPRRRDGHLDNASACNGCHGISGVNRPGTVADIPGYLQGRPDFSAAEIDRIRRIYPANAQQILATDAARYRETLPGLLGDRLLATDTVEWDDFITLRGQYESKLGLRQGALELGTDLTTAQREVQPSPRRRALLPLTLTEPLVTREEWMCHFRRIAREVRGATFCSGTFTAAALRALCDGMDDETGP